MKKNNKKIIILALLLCCWNWTSAQSIKCCFYDQCDNQFDQDYTFISYCTSDTNYVKCLNEILANDNCLYWDFINSGCKNPDLWDSENITSIIMNAKFVIIILSENYWKSSFCQEEREIIYSNNIIAEEYNSEDLCNPNFRLF